jgi:hypothetical protein
MAPAGNGSFVAAYDFVSSGIIIVSEAIYKNIS